MIINSQIKQEKVQPCLIIQAPKPSLLRIMKPVINLGSCEKAYTCIKFCPRNAITMNQKGQPTINYDLCDGCLICLRECPHSAIREERNDQ